MWAKIFSTPMNADITPMNADTPKSETNVVSLADAGTFFIAAEQSMHSSAFIGVISAFIGVLKTFASASHQ